MASWLNRWLACSVNILENKFILSGLLGCLKEATTLECVPVERLSGFESSDIAFIASGWNGLLRDISH